jgi:hypothetical protein
VPKREREPLGIFVGDLHVGSYAAPAPLGLCQRAEMEAQLGRWQQFTARALAEMKGKAAVLFLGGDLVDGIHHNTRGNWGTFKDQRDAAIELLRPLANAASAIYALTGTEVHAGAEGDDDKQVAQELGAKATAHAWRLTLGGKRLFWSHHGTTVPRNVTAEDGGLLVDALRHYELSLRGVPKPDLVVHHHNHFSPDPITRHGITVAVCPCWQGGTLYGAKVGPERTPDIGGLFWWPKQNRIERVLYPVVQEYQEVEAAR